MLTRLDDTQARLKSGEISCVERVHFFLQNIEAKKELHAFLDVYADEAMAQAKRVDEKIKNNTAGKLAGLVVGIKDVIAYKNHLLHAGSKILANYNAPYSATIVERLLKEDAILIGHQNCDEFAMGSSNENSAFGAAKNPHDTTRVPGGSSGGSAVAVAADLCDVSIGSDTGGSVRQPAAFCGVYGLKPTYSRISRHGIVAYASSFDCIGILAKHEEDMARVLEVIAGADEFDGTVSQKPVPSYSTEKKSTKPFRFAVPSAVLSYSGLQPEIKEALEKLITTLKKNYVVEEIDFPFQDYLLPVYYILATAEASSNLSRFDGVRYGYRTPDEGSLLEMYKKTRSEAFGREVQRRILLGTFVLSAGYYDAYFQQAQKVRTIIRQYIKTIFSTYDFILQPITPTSAFPLGVKPTDPVQVYWADIYSVLANVAGIPAVAFPVGHDKQGLPIGLQAMADDFEEEKLLELCRILRCDLPN